MKKLIFTIFLFAFITALKAQNSKVGPFEVEVAGGITQSWNSKAGQNEKSYATPISGRLILEWRYNSLTSPWDIGFNISLDGFHREWPDDYSRHYNTLMTGVYWDYNFRDWKKHIAPYVGIGLAGGYLDTKIWHYDRNMGGERTYELCLNLRFGVEFYKHIRVNCDFKLMTKLECSHFGFTVGIVIGGGGNSRKAKQRNAIINANRLKNPYETD